MSTESRLLRWFDQTKRKLGKVEPGFYISTIKKSTNTSEILSLVDRYEKHFGDSNWRLFAAAAARAAHRDLEDRDAELAASFLLKIPKQNLPDMSDSTPRAVLACSSKLSSKKAAQVAFDMIKDHTPADTGILVHLGGVETPQGKVIIRHVLSKPANPSMDLSTITTFLQFCTKCHDLDLALNVWSWCKPVRDQTKDERGLMIITLVFLLFCGRIDLNLGRSVWNEIKALKLHHYPQLVGAMLSVLASHRASGEADEIIAQLTLGKMMNEKMLSSLLCSYSHVGRGEEAWLLLQRIKSETPDVVNLFSYNAVIDALARSGKFDRAFEIADCAKKAGFTPDLITWMSILSPCRARSDLSNAVKAFNYIKNLQSPGDHLAAAYVVMADVYRASGNEQAARLLHRERLDRKLFKQRGAVKMTMGGKSYEFHVAQIPKDLLHLAEAVELKLEEWTLYLESQGASTESIQCRHSENMALACAVVSGLKVVVLRKNLRICSSCHIASLLITVLEGIEIHHWDNSVVHKMKNGLCSCCSYY